MTLTHCPRCDYSLEGLPEVHPCPECGLVCDRGAEVFALRRSLLLGADFPLAVLPIMWFAQTLLALEGWFSGARFGYLESLFLLGLGLSWVLWIAPRLRTSRFAVVLPRHICVRTLTVGRRVIDIDEVECVEHGGSLLSPDLVALRPRDAKKAKWAAAPPIRFESVWAADRFTKQVRDRLATSTARYEDSNQ